MPFIKLDCGMLHSTIWFDKNARDILITSLLMAEPREITAPMAQLEVDSLTPTGWEVPPGWYGYVPAAGTGIARIADVDLQTGIAALRRMGEPEPESRSQAFDGRRMARVDGGYLILNYMAYRERDYTSAVRSRRYREKKLNARHAVTDARHAVASRDVTQAEAEAEAEAERDLDTQVGDLSEAVGAEVAPPPSPPFLVFPCSGQVKAWTLHVSQVERWKELFPGVDVEAECRSALAWVEAAGARRKTASGMARFLSSWLSRSQNSGRGRRQTWTDNRGQAKSDGNIDRLAGWLERKSR